MAFDNLSNVESIIAIIAAVKAVIIAIVAGVREIIRTARGEDTWTNRRRKAKNLKKSKK